MTIVNEADNAEGDDKNETLPSILVSQSHRARARR